MFDLRYHVASLAAVFLALIIGIVVGVGISGKGFVSDSERALLNERIADLNNRLDSATQTGERADEDAARRADVRHRRLPGTDGPPARRHARRARIRRPGRRPDARPGREGTRGFRSRRAAARPRAEAAHRPGCDAKDARPASRARAARDQGTGRRPRQAARRGLRRRGRQPALAAALAAAGRGAVGQCDAAGGRRGRRALRACAVGRDGAVPRRLLCGAGLGGPARGRRRAHADAATPQSRHSTARISRPSTTSTARPDAFRSRCSSPAGRPGTTA